MHVRIEHRDELIEIGQQVVSEHQRVRGALHQLDLWRLDHHFRGGLHRDLALLHLELDEVAAIGIAQGDRLAAVVQSQEQALFGADDLVRGVVAAPVSSLGSWPLPHQQPVQMGRETSPDSNSIHTPASAAGTV